MRSMGWFAGSLALTMLAFGCGDDDGDGDGPVDSGVDQGLPDLGPPEPDPEPLPLPMSPGTTEEPAQQSGQLAMSCVVSKAVYP